MADRLDRYRSMRDFEATPEPAGEARPGPADAPRFVVQEHHARRLHWDLRLERDGTLASWAVPRGIPPDPAVNHLAVHTEDHPLEYLEFHGEIPKGQYGAGRMTIWDRGTYECHKWEDNEVQVTLHGERVDGRYVLFRTKGDDWMIHRMDAPQDPGREPVPVGLAPMRAVPGDRLPGDEAWAYELLWPGRRLLLFVQGGRMRALGDGGEDTARWPELSALGRALGCWEAVLDAVVVGPGGDGRPDAERLARRAEDMGETTRRRRAKEMPAVAMLLDVVYLDGRVVARLPYEERRARLGDLGLAGPAWQTPRHHDDGAALLEAARAQGLPGVVAKRLGSEYRPGEESPDWVEVRA
jgi:bifunctional non-homologous end joining protein LigD